MMRTRHPTVWSSVISVQKQIGNARPTALLPVATCPGDRRSDRAEDGCASSGRDIIEQAVAHAPLDPGRHREQIGQVVGGSSQRHGERAVTTRPSRTHLTRLTCAARAHVATRKPRCVTRGSLWPRGTFRRRTKRERQAGGSSDGRHTPQTWGPCCGGCCGCSGCCAHPLALSALGCGGVVVGDGWWPNTPGCPRDPWHGMPRHRRQPLERNDWRRRDGRRARA